MYKLSDNVNRKFIESFDVSDWEIDTDTGWQDISSIHKTIEYQKYIIKTESGSYLECADTHIIFDENLNEIFVKDCIPNKTKIITRNGPELVISVEITDIYENMYDITVDSNDHRFWSGNILSHNSTTTCGFILWYIIFHSEKVVALLANKGDTAREILGRVQLAYQHLPKWLQQGVVEWNKGSFVLENNSRVIAAATSASAIRGYTINLLFIDEAAFIDNWDEFFTSVYPTISSGQESKIVLVSCVTKDTMVFTENGIKTVSDFINPNALPNPSLGYTIQPYSVLGKNGLNYGNIMVNSGKAKTKKIVTQHSELECSLNHKIYAYHNNKFQWVKAEDLLKEDYVAVSYGKNIWGKNNIINDITVEKNSYRETNFFEVPNEINSDLAYILGLYLAEGYTRKIESERGYQTVITCGDDISSIISKLGLNFSCKDGIHYIINSRSFDDFLEKFGFNINLKSKNKIIPPRLFEMSSDIVASFLCGYFDGDGHISKTRNYINVCSTSETLINQTRMLLNNFGILTTKRHNITKPTKKVNVVSEVWYLEISGNYYKTFCEKIGFRLTRKKDLIKKFISRNGSSQDIIPNLRSICEENNIKLPKTGQYKNKNNYSRQWCLNNIHIKTISDIVSPDIRWSKVKSISDSENEVYDFSLNHIEDDKWCHSVVYNGIIGHQTPNGLNHFHKTWTNAFKTGEEHNGYNPILVNWQDVPGRDEKWKQETLAGMNFDIEKFSQEMECSFLGSSGTLIAGWKLKQLVSKKPLIEKEGLIQFFQPEENHVYIMICDVSRGKGLDYSAFQLIDVTQMPYQQVCVFRNNAVTPIDYAEVIHRVAKAYNNASILTEINDIGEQVSNSLHYDFGYEHILFTENAGRSGKRITSGFGGGQVDKGIRTTKVVKSVGCSILKLLIEQDQLIINDFETINELSTFSKRNNSYEAEPGKNDDLVMCLVLFSWLSEQQYFKDYTNINTLMSLRDKTEEDIEQDLSPFGFVVSGADEASIQDIWEEARNPDSWMFRPIETLDNF